jgi:hypothetical protein
MAGRQVEVRMQSTDIDKALDIQRGIRLGPNAEYVQLPLQDVVISFRCSLENRPLVVGFIR